MLYVKYGENRLNGFRGDVIWKCWRRGWQMPAYTISSPMSLWLRWAKNGGKCSENCNLYIKYFDKIKWWCRPNIPSFFQSWNLKHTYVFLALCFYMGRAKRIWYLSPMRAAKVQASLRIHAVSPEPSLLAHTSSESRGTFRQKARSLAPLNGWACAVKICHDGMLEDTNSLDGAHMFFYVSQ